VNNQHNPSIGSSLEAFDGNLRVPITSPATRTVSILVGRDFAAEFIEEIDHEGDLVRR
jgi:hypothetical protein